MMIFFDVDLIQIEILDLILDKYSFHQSIEPF